MQNLSDPLDKLTTNIPFKRSKSKENSSISRQLLEIVNYQTCVFRQINKTNILWEGKVVVQTENMPLKIILLFKSY